MGGASPSAGPFIQVGDVVNQIFRIGGTGGVSLDGQDFTESFEDVISVEGTIKQNAATDLSTSGFFMVLSRPI